MTGYQVEASDFDREGMQEGTVQYKDQLLGRYVPDIEGADRLPKDRMREHGYRNL